LSISIDCDRSIRDLDAVVLFLGCPMVAGDTAEQLKSWNAKLVVVSAALPWYDELVRQGVVRLAIIPRASTDSDSASAPASPGPSGARAEFDRDYRILRSEGAAEKTASKAAAH
jgi:hypothetical protein